ncbi:DUF5977 domain-containing protein [Chryseobacterium sp. JAH]|uniref:DUF5977 domain-containing protein n=1 Tax=Chryseobacterium sp. JAH TaxID=1742858 RepID=UPI000740CA4B|nr:DUF5977 domain-containing protein [Chryseobacterium sp. JAH]KUJ49707.1 hypothetical protein AR685_17760 [Chryseobacterium sp. JAH]
MKKILLILLISTIFSVHGQTNPGGLIQNSVNSIAPKSPDAAALFRYTETPVSLYTGVPDISIPIYTIKEGNIELPITISYHAGGIKVTDEASSVGLGWSLNAGGRVSHIVSGVNDFNLNGYRNTYPRNATGMQSMSSCISLPWNTSTYSSAFYTNMFYPTNSYGYTSINDDFQPDLFLINLPGKSYKAYLDMAKTTQANGVLKFAIAEQPNIDFKLTDVAGATGGYNFAVTDENGLKYSFDKQEITTNITGWNTINGMSRILSKIEDVEGSKIDFYSSNPISNSRLTGCKTTRTYLTDPLNFYQGSMNIKGVTDCSKQQTGESYLERIEFTNGKVEFNWTTREDIHNSKKLSSIKIYNSYKLIKQYDFNYDYFIATDNLNTSVMRQWLNLPNDHVFTHRLRLLSVTESVTNEKYSFEYNSTYNLPNKLSFSSDFWGYYNGQNNSDTFIPDPEKYIKGETIFNVNSFNKDLTGYWYHADSPPQSFDPNNNTQGYFNYSSDGKHYLSDRRTSLYSLAGLLTSVNYPTGGKTEYEFEPNTFSNFPLQSSINDNTRKEAAASHIITNINGSLSHTANQTEFSVIGNNIKVNIFAHFDFYYISSVNEQIKNSFWIYIKNKSTGEIVKKVYNPNIGSYNTTNYIDNVILQSGNYEVGMSYNNDFTSGNILVSGGSSAASNSCVVKFVNEKSIINGIEYNYSSGGGVRIKSVKSIEKIGTPPIVKNYIYDEVSDNGTKITSNGNLAQFPKFFEIESRCYSTDNLSQTISSNPGCYMNLNTPQSPNEYPFKISVYEGTSSFGNSTLPQGNHVGYTKVIEKFNDKGRTESYFTNNYSLSCLMMVEKGGSLLIGDGDLVKQLKYDNDNNRLKEISYKYIQNYPDGLNTYSIQGSILEPLTNFGFSFNTNNQATLPGLIHNYSINLWKTLLESTTSKDYFPAGSSSFIETKSFTTYNNKYQPNIQKTIYPDLSFDETTYNYAYEKGNQLLIDKNMVGIPLETIITRTANGVSKTLSKIENVYPTSLPDSQIGNFVLPKSVKSQDISNGSTSFTEITVDKYDTKGNLIQYTAKDGNPISIVWGYNFTLPIAKIEGAAYDNIATFVSDIITKSNEDALDPTKEQMLLDAEDNLRKNSNFSSYQISTYTHDPLIGVTSVTPSSGLREYYKYDTTNRLEKIVDINSKLLKEFNYHYASNSSTIFHNEEKSKVFTRTNCPLASSVPGTYNYVVPVGTYFSTVSLLAANQKALDDINMNGQNIANQNGPCIPILSCPFTFSSLTNNASYKYNGTTNSNNNISFNVSFSAYGIWQNWANGLNIGTIEGDCKPTSNKEINYFESSFNRQWKIFIDTAGNCTLRLLSGTVNASSTNPIILQFQYQK